MPGIRPNSSWQPQAIIDWYELELEYQEIELEKARMRNSLSFSRAVVSTSIPHAKFPWVTLVMGVALIALGLIFIIVTNTAHGHLPTP